jgi:hypothetical protein
MGRMPSIGLSGLEKIDRHRLRPTNVPTFDQTACFRRIAKHWAEDIVIGRRTVNGKLC